MRFKELLESCQIFVDSGLGEAWPDYDHDVMYGPNLDQVDEQISPENQKRLKELGWCRDENQDCLAAF